jgi:virginiamycin B lyase
MTDRTANAVLRCTTAGDCTPIHFPRPGAQLGAITAGPDGAVWVVEDWQASGLGFIARIATGSFTEFRVPTGTDCGLVSAGGALWFNQREANRIARMTTAGVLTEYALPSDGSYPVGIALGPDGRIWFAEYGGGRIGHL